MCFGEILKMELNVALNRVKDADFELGVQKVLQRPNVYGEYEKRGGNPGFQKGASEAQIDSYFAENPAASKIDLDIVEGSLLPTRHFFEEFADSIRVYINETSTP